MPTNGPRTPIPSSVENALRTANARVCCVCRTRGLGTNFHHIDRDPSNNDPGNIAVLCVREHDQHHRPDRYAPIDPSVNHTEMSADDIRRHKQEWEYFVGIAKGPHSRVVASLTVYGEDASHMHSMGLVFQNDTEKIYVQRTYHLLMGPMEDWIDFALGEIKWLNSDGTLKLALINGVQNVKYCPGCKGGLSTTVNAGMVTKLTAADWSEKAMVAIYINPHQPSLALNISYNQKTIETASIHRCSGQVLHFACDSWEERVPIQKGLGVRTQVSRLIKRHLNDWDTPLVLFGTGDPDNPTLIKTLALPSLWENKRPKRKRPHVNQGHGLS